ncbi:MAG: M48 family metallopeptidase [Bacteroidota bacterium]
MNKSFFELIPLAWNQQFLICIWFSCLSFFFFPGSPLIFSGSQLYAQDFNHYQLLKGKGPIPERFLTAGSYDAFQLYQGGKVLFNDPVSQYLAEIVDYLLKDQPEVRKTIEVYAVRSPLINAFSSRDGVILVNLGLIAHLDNEAELAFVLCHEISHYVQRHQQEVFRSSQRLIQQSTNKLKTSSLQEQLQRFQFYSQQKELEADSLGLELFLKTDYNLNAPRSSLEHLIRQSSPFIQTTFSLSLFELQKVQLPSRVLLPDSLLRISAFSIATSDSLSSHPATQQRIQLLDSIKHQLSNQGRRFWMLGKSRFDRLKQVSLFEVTHLFLLSQQYESAIFYATHLLNQHPHSSFLKKVIAQSLYGLAKFSNAGRFWDVHQDFEDILGEGKKLHYLMENLLPEELNLLALVYLWDIMKKEESDLELELMMQDLSEEFSKQHLLENNLSHVQSWVLDPDFWDFLETLPTQDSSSQSTALPYQLSEKQKRLKGVNLGLNNVVFAEPMYLQLDWRRTQPIRHEASEQKRQWFTKILKQHSEQVELKSEFLSSFMLSSKDIDKFNDISLLNDWMEEKLSTHELKLVSINHTEIQQLRKRYQTPYFVWTEIISLTQKRNGKLLIASAGILFPPILPYAAYYLLTPKRETIMFTMIFDLDSGNPILMLPQNIQMKDRPDLLHSLSYDLIYQIQQTSN